MNVDAALRDYRAKLLEARWEQAHARHAADRAAHPGIAYDCGAEWPPSRADVSPSPCQLTRGHTGAHYHRPPGGHACVEWVSPL